MERRWAVVRLGSLSLTLRPPVIHATVMASIRRIVHDPDHRPVPQATVLLESASSYYSQTVATDADGAFEAASIPVGVYRVTLTRDGFAPAVQQVVASSGSAPVPHFQLAVGFLTQTVDVAEETLSADPEAMTPPP